MFGGLFDEQDDNHPHNHPHPLDAMSVPIAPPLFDASGQRVVVPKHMQMQFAYGEDQQDSLPYPGSVPLLRRNLSLSLNTPHALHARLQELEQQAINEESAHKCKLLELETALKREEASFKEKRRRVTMECEAIEKALDKIRIREKHEEEKHHDAACCANHETGALTPASSGSGSLMSPLSVRRSPGCDRKTGDETGCGVCLSADRDTLIAPCAHVALCFACATAIKQSKNPECPFCRVRITAVYKLFVV